MSLPEQIQKQVDEAKSIIEKHYGPSATSAEEGTPALTPDESASPAKDAAPDTTVAPASPPVDDKSFEQRWRSLQGIYNAQAQELNNTKQRIAQLEQVLATMQSTPVVAPAPAQPAARLVTEADDEEFGDRYVDFVRRAAKDETTALMATVESLRSEVASLKSLAPVVNTVAATQRKSASDQFFADIAQAVPEWQRINADTRFHEWLVTPDPMTGIARQTYLEAAQNSLDASRAVNIFRSWIQASGTPAVTPVPARTPTPAVSELERQIAPGRPTATSVPSKEGARQWTPQDITAFYDEVRRGMYKGREAERAETERDLFRAQAEGRVVRRAA